MNHNVEEGTSDAWTQVKIMIQHNLYNIADSMVTDFRTTIMSLCGYTANRYKKRGNNIFHLRGIDGKKV